MANFLANHYIASWLTEQLGIPSQANAHIMWLLLHKQLTTDADQTTELQPDLLVSYSQPNGLVLKTTPTAEQCK